MGYFRKVRNIFFHPKQFLLGRDIEREEGYWKVLYPYVITSLIYLACYFIFLLISGLIVFGNNQFVGIENLSLSLFVFQMIFVVFYGIIFSFATPFVSSAIIHLGVLIFRGKEGFFNTFKPITYSGIIPLIYSIILAIVLAPIFIILLPGIIDGFASVLAQYPTGAIPEGAISQDLASQLAVLIVVSVIAGFIIGLLSFIHMLYAAVVGISHYQKLSKVKAFFSIIIVPILLGVVLLIFFLLMFILLIAVSSGSSVGVTGQAIASVLS